MDISHLPANLILIWKLCVIYDLGFSFNTDVMGISHLPANLILI